MNLLVQDKVQDAGRALKSKTKEVVQYGEGHEGPKRLHQQPANKPVVWKASK